MKDLAVCISNDNQLVNPFQTIDAIEESGFRNVFIQWYDKDFEVSQLEQYNYVKSKGLNIIFAHLGYKDLNNIWLDNEIGVSLVNKYLRNIDEIYSLGINMVVMHLANGYDAPRFNKLGLSRFKKICDYALEKNIKVAFENTKIPGYQEYILDNIDNSNVGICFDSGHYHCHFKDNYDFKRFYDKIICIHIHDNHGEFDEHLLPGDGNINFDQVFNGLKIANYNSYLTLELCYRNQYTNMSINDFYKFGYDIGIKLLKKYNGGKQ